MPIPAWFWPPSGQTIRAAPSSLVPFGAGSGFMLADWSTPSLWPFSGSTFGTPITNLSPAVSGLLPSGLLGFTNNIANLSDPTIMYTAMWGKSDGKYTSFQVTSAGSFGFFNTPFSGGPAVTIDGAPYIMQADGNVINPANRLVIGKMGYPLPAGNLPLVYGNLFAIQAAASGLGYITYAGGATGLITSASALTTPLCLPPVFSAWPLVVGAMSDAPVLSMFNAGAVSPVTPTLAMTVIAGSASLWTTPSKYSADWSVSGTITGVLSGASSVPNSLAWVPNGAQALVFDKVNGTLQVLAYAAGNLSIAQTVAVTGASGGLNTGQIAIMPDSTNALLIQPNANSVQPLVSNAGTWSLSGAVVTGVVSPQAIASLGIGYAAVIGSGALYYLSQINNQWSISSSAAIATGSVDMVADSVNRLYIASTARTLQVFSGTTLIGQGSWATVNAKKILVNQGRVMIVINSCGLLMMVPDSPTTYVEGNTYLYPRTAAPPTMGYIPASLFNSTVMLGAPVGTNIGTCRYDFSGAPYTLQRVQAGAVGYWNGGSWPYIVNLGVDHIPSAIAYDFSGKIWVATVQNDLYSLNSSGAILTSGIVQSYQAQTVPLGVSALLASGSNVWAATCMPGVLIEAI